MLIAPAKEIESLNIMNNLIENYTQNNIIIVAT